jgi:hypothetical protein
VPKNFENAFSNFLNQTVLLELYVFHEDMASTFLKQMKACDCAESKKNSSFKKKEE